MANGARYNGPPEFIEGVPARDLSEDEWQALPEEIREAAIGAGVYSLGGRRKKGAPKRGETFSTEEGADPNEVSNGG